MSVRPVICIPWMEENDAYLGAIDEGARFRLMMNTGGIVLLSFEDKRDV